jgi:hypothetical protein
LDHGALKDGDHRHGEILQAIDYELFSTPRLHIVFRTWSQNLALLLSSSQ